MKKQEFIAQLRTRLGGLPKEEAEERLNFYGEMIDDRMEDGLGEEDAVADVGTVDEVATRILAEFPLPYAKSREARSKGRALQTWEIVLLAVSAPIWFPLLVAALAVVFSLYASLWSVIVSLWAAGAGLVGGAVGGLIGGAGFLFMGQIPAGLAAVGGGLVCAGIAVLGFFGCKAATKGAAFLTKWGVSLIFKCFRRKESEI